MCEGTARSDGEAHGLRTFRENVGLRQIGREGGAGGISEAKTKALYCAGSSSSSSTSTINHRTRSVALSLSHFPPLFICLIINTAGGEILPVVHLCTSLRLPVFPSVSPTSPFRCLSLFAASPREALGCLLSLCVCISI